jgi:uracil-DNA glycosylase family 4
MDWKRLNQQVISCERCPRLRLYCQAIASKRKKEFSAFDYWGKPVPGFGDVKAGLWIIGLAPAAHGANRTGRMFSGDSSGVWLYRALHSHGFANQPHSTHLNDGLVLNDTFISAAVRCAPPDNRPSPEELDLCSTYLDEEFKLLSNKKVFLALGQIAFKSALNLLNRHNISITTPRPKFQHGALYKVGPYQLLVSYHPSRQNTNTGLLTPLMWDQIFKKAKHLIKA